MNGLVFDLQLFEGNTLISGTSGDDNIMEFNVENVTIDTGNGNDAIMVECGENVVIQSGVGNDKIEMMSLHNITVDAGTGDDYVDLQVGLKNVSITLGDGKDTLNFSAKGDNTTVNDLNVNDVLCLNTLPTFAKFTNGVLNIGDIAKINLPNVTNINDYRNMIVNVVSGSSWHGEDLTVVESITLGELLDAPASYWKVSGTTATYYDGDGSVILTLTGLKSGLKVV